VKQLRQELMNKTEFRGEVNLDTSNMLFKLYQTSVVYSYIQRHVKMFSTLFLLSICFKVEAVTPAVLM